MLCTTQRKFRSSHFNSVVKGKGPGSCLRNWTKSCLNILQGSWSYWSNFSWNSTWKISSNLSLCSILTIPACEVILGCRAAGVWTSAEMCWGEVQLMMASYRRSFNSSSVKQNCSNKWFVQRYAKLKVTNSETLEDDWLNIHSKMQLKISRYLTETRQFPKEFQSPSCHQLLIRTWTPFCL